MNYPVFARLSDSNPAKSGKYWLVRVSRELPAGTTGTALRTGEYFHSWIPVFLFPFVRK